MFTGIDEGVPYRTDIIPLSIHGEMAALLTGRKTFGLHGGYLCHRDAGRMTQVALTLRDGGGSLALSWKSGKPWLTMNTATWRLTHIRPTGAFAWRWVLAGIGGAAIPLLGLGALLVSRRRQPREAVPVPL